jgi:hypothetical protein
VCEEQRGANGVALAPEWDQHCAIARDRTGFPPAPLWSIDPESECPPISGADSGQLVHGFEGAADEPEDYAPHGEARVQLDDRSEHSREPGVPVRPLPVRPLEDEPIDAARAAIALRGRRSCDLCGCAPQLLVVAMTGEDAAARVHLTAVT